MSKVLVESSTGSLSRRQFLGQSAAVGSGLVIAISAPWSMEATAQSSQPAEVNAWVVVRPDDSVVIRIARSEMGQGTLTGLAQLVAEELDCDWAKVTTEYPTPGQNLARNRVWGNFSTGGSRGIRDSQDYVRKGGAIARMMLVQAAADEWQVSAADCRAANSIITHVPSGRTTTFGKVATAAGKLAQPTAVSLKNPKDWKLAGKRLARLDTVDKTTGAQMYGIDLTLPGMLNAAIKDCPVFGGKLKSFDAGAIASRKGVKKVVRVNDSTVAVVADTWWQAKTALELLPIEWDEGPHAKASSEAFAKVLDAAPEPCHHGADERHRQVLGCGQWHTRAVRSLDTYPEWRGRVGCCLGGLGSARLQMRGLQADARRWLRSPWRHRLDSSGRQHRQANAGHPGQIDLEP